MDHRPWWSFDRFYRVFLAIASVTIFVLLFIRELGISDGSGFVLGGIGYFAICFLPVAIIISVVGAAILGAIYFLLSSVLLMLIGNKYQQIDIINGVYVCGYLLLLFSVYLTSKSIGQPDGQAVLAALFMTPFVALAIYVVLAAATRIIKEIARFIGAIRILE